MRRLAGLLGLLLACRAAQHSPEPSPCTRGEPSPLIDPTSDAVLRASFRRDGAEANERVSLRGGQSWDVRHWGCESFVLTVALSLPGDPSAPPTVAGALDRAAAHLREVQQQSVAVRLSEVADLLSALADRPEPPPVGQPIPFGQLSGMDQTLLLTEAPPASSGPITVRWELKIGPL